MRQLTFIALVTLMLLAACSPTAAEEPAATPEPPPATHTPAPTNTSSPEPTETVEVEPAFEPTSRIMSQEELAATSEGGEHTFTSGVFATDRRGMEYMLLTDLPQFTFEHLDTDIFLDHIDQLGLNAPVANNGPIRFEIRDVGQVSSPDNIGRVLKIDMESTNAPLDYVVGDVDRQNGYTLPIYLSREWVSSVYGRGDAGFGIELDILGGLLVIQQGNTNPDLKVGTNAAELAYQTLNAQEFAITASFTP